MDGRKIKAGIVDANSDKVTLRAPNGKTGGIALEDLSKGDQEYVKKWIENNAKPKGFGEPDRIIEITTLKGEMKYNKPLITVYPGKKIKLILRNNDDMHHNLAITKRGKGNDLKVAQEAWKLGRKGSLNIGFQIIQIYSSQLKWLTLTPLPLSILLPPKKQESIHMFVLYPVMLKSCAEP